VSLTQAVAAESVKWNDGETMLGAIVVVGILAVAIWLLNR
jgi:hypothetical protein